MKTIFREPQVEEGARNIILQNRCGNRLTLMFFDDRTELEFVYKPNAFRRKEYRARNFSNRDNFTTLFAAAAMPYVKVDMLSDIGYDPFVTTLKTLAPSGAANTISIVNVADENCFALAARCPLVLTFRPRGRFEVSDGLLTEKFTDRGEDIVSFIKFQSMEQNRFRLLDDGTAVLQLFENEVVLVGGEENDYQVNRVLRRLGGLDLPGLVAHTEERIDYVLSQGRVTTPDAELQKVLDINRRLVYSGLDEGGACFGALNRIYHLIWIRDGSMAASLFARAGTPEFARIWAPFALDNPSVRLTNDGERAVEFLQILGTRWTKAEDDGLYYVVLSLYEHYVRTGDDRLLSTARLSGLLDILDHLVKARFLEKDGLFGSDTVGETTLPSSPYYGYDSVNGLMHQDFETKHDGKRVMVNMSLYYNMNLYNVLKMALVLCRANPGVAATRLDGYRRLASVLEQTFREKFSSPDGLYYGAIVEFDDGSRAVTKLSDDSNPWEYSWAVTVGPFLPDLPRCLASARAVAKQWKKRVGYCPWNAVSYLLKEYGLSSADYRRMLTPEINDARDDLAKYPMKWALTEYADWKDTWHGLPFQAGTLLMSVCGNLLQAQPQGVAVRASDLVDRVDNYVLRDARIWAAAEGKGDVVVAWTLNDTAMSHTLVIPDCLLRPGVNKVKVQRGASCDKPRLFATAASLRDVSTDAKSVTYHLHAPVSGCWLVFDNYRSLRSVRITDASGKQLRCEAQDVLDTGKSVIVVECEGDFTFSAQL
jgi:hypothetical protein